MTSFRCETCGRELAGDTAFCPYCGADRRPAAPALPADIAPAPAASPNAPGLAPSPPQTSTPPAPSPPPTPVAPAATPAAPATPPRRKRKRLGCATPLLIVLVAILAGVSWCALRRLPSRGAPAVPGAVAVQRLHVSRHWRTVSLPGDAPATARFAVSSDTALRVRAAGRVYAVRPGHPLRLPEDLGESFDLRAADYVSTEDAAKARVALSTLRGG